MKRKFVKFIALVSAAFVFAPNSVMAAPKIPLLDSANTFQVSNVNEATALLRLQEKWVVVGTNSQDQSWVAQYDQKGVEIWRLLPIVTGKGGDGFITAAAVDSRGIVIAGVSQNPIDVQIDSPSEALPTTTPTPSVSSSQTATKNVPLVNPDKVVPTPITPLRKDINNIFLIRVDSSGKITDVLNTSNKNGFVPSSIAVNNLNTYLAGNQLNGENQSRGALLKFSAGELVDSFTFGENQTTLTRVLTTSRKSLTVIGSSAESIAGRKVVGKRDGVILTISQVDGKVSNIVRSSGKGAVRSWDSASGNLIVVGTSRLGTTRETVITSFTTKGVVAWTTRFPKSIKALNDGNCIANSTSSLETSIYLYDGKGKQIKGARLPKQELLGVATTPTKGCAILTMASAGDIRVSYL